MLFAGRQPLAGRVAAGKGCRDPPVLMREMGWQIIAAFYLWGRKRFKFIRSWKRFKYVIRLQGSMLVRDMVWCGHYVGNHFYNF